MALIGAGKFATMYLHQALRTPGVQVCAVCDLEPERARAALAAAGWSAEQMAPVSLAQAQKAGTTWVTEDAAAAIHPSLDVVIEATGDPLAGVAHAEACVAAGVHLVMVNVEADVLAGPWLAKQARAAGLVYSLAFGDQPALIAELVDWARVCGFEVVCAGKGTKYLPAYHRSTPDTVWEHYGLEPEQARAGGMNATMFNSFLDGTKSAIEMAAVANACGLEPPPDGLDFPPCGCAALAQVLRPRARGGVLHHTGTVEVVSSLTREGAQIPDDLRWGVYVTFAGDSDYARRCFREYGLVTDDSGQYTALYRPYHLIGLELGVSVAAAALRGEPTGSAQAFRGDVAAVAKCALRAGQRLDGEGGYTVWGRLLPAAEAMAERTLPIGLAKGARLRRDVDADTAIRLDDVALDRDSAAWRARAQLMSDYGPAPVRAGLAVE